MSGVTMSLRVDAIFKKKAAPAKKAAGKAAKKASVSIPKGGKGEKNGGGRRDSTLKTRPFPLSPC